MAELRAIIRNLLERSQIVHSELRFSQGGKTLESSQNLPSNAQETQLNQQKLQKQLELTPREEEVLKFPLDGYSNIDIGLKLHLSHRTIEKYVSSLLRKSDTSNRIELIRLALKYSLVQ